MKKIKYNGTGKFKKEQHIEHLYKSMYPEKSNVQMIITPYDYKYVPKNTKIIISQEFIYHEWHEVFAFNSKKPKQLVKLQEWPKEKVIFINDSHAFCQISKTKNIRTYIQKYLADFFLIEKYVKIYNKKETKIFEELLLMKVYNV